MHLQIFLYINAFLKSRYITLYTEKGIQYVVDGCTYVNKEKFT